MPKERLGLELPQEDHGGPANVSRPLGERAAVCHCLRVLRKMLPGGLGQNMNRDLYCFLAYQLVGTEVLVTSQGQACRYDTGS